MQNNAFPNPPVYPSPEKKIRILIVDDEKHIRESLVEFLATEKNLHVETASNGQEALEKISENKPHLVILDKDMPIMNGLELYSKLKANSEYKDISVIFHTANPKDLPRKSVFLEKPCDLNKFLAKIKESIKE
jgi:two-component system, chemotaxis family, response regulator PixH